MPPTTTAASPPQFDIRPLLEAGASNAGPQTLTGFNPFLVLPTGYEKRDLTPATPTPLLPYIKQDVVLEHPESFIDYVNLFKTGISRIFGTVDKTGKGAKFFAVLDYHHPKPDGETQADRIAHKAFYPAPFSEEWDIWTKASGRAMSQIEFADFIDDNIVDVIEPAGATLLEMALNFQIKRDAKFSSRIVRQSGSQTLSYVDNSEATGGAPGIEGTIKVPEKIKLLLPIFHGGNAFEVAAKINYRPDNSSLKISYTLYRPNKVVEAAVKDIIADIETGTTIKPLVGFLA